MVFILSVSQKSHELSFSANFLFKSSTFNNYMHPFTSHQKRDIIYHLLSYPIYENGIECCAITESIVDVVAVCFLFICHAEKAVC